MQHCKTFFLLLLLYVDVCTVLHNCYATEHHLLSLSSLSFFAIHSFIFFFVFIIIYLFQLTSQYKTHELTQSQCMKMTLKLPGIIYNPLPPSTHLLPLSIYQVNRVIILLWFNIQMTCSDLQKEKAQDEYIILIESLVIIMIIINLISI